MLELLRNRALMVVALGHFSVDMYSGMLPVILLALTEPLNLSYAQIGLISAAFTVTSSLTQPLFGWLSDRIGGRSLAAGGIIIIALGMGAMRTADWFTVLLVLAAIAGLGSAAFHPQGAANAAIASGARRATGMSIFMLGGNTGFATGPIVARLVFAAAGQAANIILTAIGIVLGLVQLWAAPGARRAEAKTPGKAALPASLNDYRPMQRNAAIALVIVIFMRQWVQSGLTTYIPQWATAQGYSVEYASNLLFVMLMPFAVGGLIGGNLADRIGRKPIILGSLVAVIPLILLLLANPGPAAFFIAPFVGMMVGASMPVTLVMAQELLPRGIGVMSGLALGFTFIAGGIGAAISGWLADHIGITPTLATLALVALVGVVCALFLPRRERRKADPVVGQTGDATLAK